MTRMPKHAAVARRGSFTADEIAARVRRYYALGKWLLGQSPKARSNQTALQLTRRRGPSAASIRAYQNEYRRFAEAYTAEELEELLTLRTTREDTPLGWGIIRKLMAVPDKARRRKLEMRAARESWTVRQAEAVIQERIFKKKRSMGGRPLTAPKNLTELLYRLEIYTGESRRRLALWSTSDIVDCSPPVRKVDDVLRDRVLAVREELNLVTRMARKLSERLSSIAPDNGEAGNDARGTSVNGGSTREPRDSRRKRS